jgi:DNA-binding NarL/FixJ family response regulator
MATRSWADAVGHFERALPAAVDERGEVLLLLARARLRAGRVEQAWEDCTAVADLARATGDTTLLADAALVVGDVGPSPLVDRVHLLCVEALARLGDRDPQRAAKLRARRDATRSPWTRPTPGLATGGDPDARFLALEAEHTAHVHVDHIDRRLALADEALALGHACGSGQYTATGLMWRIEALGQLGRRAELTAEVAALAAAVSELREPLWTSRLALVRAGQLLVDGRFAECRALSAAEPGYMGLVMASHLAVLTGEELDQVEPRVRAALDDAPYFARGWHALLLAAQSRADEAATLWRAVAPLVRELPRDSPEWLIGTVGNARLAAHLGDVDTAAVLYELLAPYAHLRAVGGGDSPDYGPVALYLGPLSALLGDTERARTELTAALRAAEGEHALPAAALAHLALARLPGAPWVHAATAARLGSQLGMTPVVTDAARLRRDGPLSRRENEVAALVAEGLSNRAIAGRLHLSERTVENHVSHVMRKTGQPTRVGVAGWYLGSAGAKP